MITLVIPDLHLPFEHSEALSFCKETYDYWGCERVVNIGDVFDHHAMSRHTSESDGMSSQQEYELAKTTAQMWAEVFPEMLICSGNHDLIPKRQAKEVGIPPHGVRELRDWYDLPETWEWASEWTLDGVLYRHIGGSAKYAAYNKAVEMSMSFVCGHTHTKPGVIYQSNPNHMFFGLNAGCLIDKSAYAMRYSDREIQLGCGVVVDSSEAYFVPMKLK